MTANQIALAKVREDSWYHQADIQTRTVANQISAERNMVSLLEAQVAQQNALTREREVAATERRNEIAAQEVQYNYILQSSRMAEEQRHNQAVEAETQRSNTVAEWQATAQRQDQYNLGVLNIQQKQREVQSQEKRSAWQLGANLLNTVGGALTKLVAIW